ncbi:MAG: HlyD family secretion protein [Polyangiales bacterium]
MVLSLLGCMSAEVETQDGVFQGVVEFDERRLAFERPGRVDQMLVAETEEVEAGQLLATLDTDLAELERDMRAAQLEAAQAKLALIAAGARSSDVRALASELRAARASVETLEDDLARNESLQNTGAVPAAQVDRLRGEVERARGVAGAVASRLTSLRSGPRSEELSIAAAQVEAADVAVRVAERSLEQFALLAPVDAQVLSVDSEPGEVAAAGRVAMVLSLRDRPFVDVFVPQNRVRDVRAGGSVEIRVDSSESVLRGTIEQIGSELEYTPRFLFSESERPNLVLRVRVRVEDPEHVLLAGVPAFVTMVP